MLLCMPRPVARNLLDDASLSSTRGRRRVPERDVQQLRRLISLSARLDLSVPQVRALLAQDAPLSAEMLNHGPTSGQAAEFALEALARTLLRQSWPSGADDAARVGFFEVFFRRAAEAGYRLAD